MLQDIFNPVVTYYFAGTVVISLLITAIIAFVLRYQYKMNKIRLLRKEEEIQKQRELYLVLEQGEEKERIRLSQELHEGIGPQLAGAKIYLQSLSSQIESALPDKSIQDLFKRIEEIISETVLEIRTTSHFLKAASLKNQTLEQAVNGLCRQLSTARKCVYTCSADGNFDLLNNEIRFNAFRIITELLMNISKHAQATEASIQLLVEDNKLQIMAEDNGIGFDPKVKVDGIGLTNIGNRLLLLKGMMNIDSTSQGTTIIVDIPLPTFVL